MEEDDADNRRRNPTREVRKYRWSNSGYRQCDIVASREMEKNRIIGNEYTPQLCRKQLRGNSSSQLVLGRNVPAAIKVLLTQFSNLLQLIPAKASDFRCMRFSYSPFVSPEMSRNHARSTLQGYFGMKQNRKEAHCDTFSALPAVPSGFMRKLRKSWDYGMRI